MTPCSLFPNWNFLFFFSPQPCLDYGYISLFILLEFSRARRTTGWVIEQYNEEKGKRKEQTRFGLAKF